MKVEYINPFIEASRNVIMQMTGLDTTLGKVSIKNAPYKNDDVVVVIGLSGEIKGSAVICFGKNLACKIASLMMGGFPVKELDDLSKSAIGELCNMILGNTSTLFSQQKMFVDITPPTILTGNNIEVTLQNPVTLSVPLVFNNGEKIGIDISFREIKAA